MVSLSNLSVIAVKTGSDGKVPENELKELKEGEILLFALKSEHKMTQMCYWQYVLFK